MLALVGGLRGIFAAIGGAGVAFALFLAWNTIWDNPRVHSAAKREGAAQERILWEEARKRLLAQMAEERKEAQRAIDEIEGQYLSQRDKDLSAIQSLEQAIEDMEAANEADTDSPARLFIPKRLSDQLNAIGR
ncbi:hypothetical protein ABWH97_13825 [Nitratireductor sp. ac15]